MDIIAQIRANGKTVTGVCLEAGISRPAFYALLDSSSNPKIRTIISVAKAAGVTPLQIRPDLALG